ncbi:MAG: hypothetical protein P8X67_08345 [Syntrophobacterales bacterium]
MSVYVLHGWCEYVERRETGEAKEGNVLGGHEARARLMIGERPD